MFDNRTKAYGDLQDAKNKIVKYVVLDDLHPEIALINEYCKQVKGIWLYNFSIEKNEWLKECDKLIENNS